MNTPPALPATGFVTVLARISLVLAAIGLAWALAQMAGALLLSDDAVAYLAARPEVPASVLWLLEHRHALSLAVLVLSALFLAVSWGLLRRREWARVAFVALLLASAAANFGGVALVGPFFDGLVGMYPPEFLDTPEGRQFAAQMRFNRLSMLVTSVAGAVVFAGLHGWLAWKLGTAAVRAEFGARRGAG
ncbi:hypothetical protein [Pseudoxanthomonas sp. 10H]|uniref:hypothetical protein n=1 Tax=Pseudoxanthomonas sp. 10H TaxID=3242729 RepID=UPI003558A990